MIKIKTSENTLTNIREIYVKTDDDTLTKICQGYVVCREDEINVLKLIYQVEEKIDNDEISPSCQFTVDRNGSNYIFDFEEGMTWAEFVESEYCRNDEFDSDLGWGVDDTMVGFYMGVIVTEVDGSVLVKPTDTIMSGHAYGWAA